MQRVTYSCGATKDSSTDYDQFKKRKSFINRLLMEQSGIRNYHSSFPQGQCMPPTVTVAAEPVCFQFLDMKLSFASAGAWAGSQ